MIRKDQEEEQDNRDMLEIQLRECLNQSKTTQKYNQRIERGEQTEILVDDHHEVMIEDLLPVQV